ISTSGAISFRTKLHNFNLALGRRVSTVFLNPPSALRTTQTILECHSHMGRPKKEHDWSPKKRSHVLGLFDGGQHTIREISDITGIPKSTVGEIKTRNNAKTKFNRG